MQVKKKLSEEKGGVSFFPKSLLFDFLETRKTSFLSEHFLESSLLINRFLCDALADFLIDEKGSFLADRLAIAAQALSQMATGLGAGYTTPRTLNTLTALKSLDDPDCVKELMRLHVPVKGTFGYRLIESCTQLAHGTSLGPADTKRVVLSAFLSDLRQQIGSCFATATALFIRTRLPVRFFKDVADLLYKGGLSRLIQGHEYQVPAAPSWGHGDLDVLFDLFEQRRLVTYVLYEMFSKIAMKDEPSFLKVWHFVKNQKAQKTSLRTLVKLFFTEHFHLPPYVWKAHLEISKKSIDSSWSEVADLWKKAMRYISMLTLHPVNKTWEYALASFSDVKLEFFHWNSFYALGLSPDIPGGLAAFLVEGVQGRMDELRKHIEEIQSDLQTTSHYINTLNLRAKNATSEHDLARMRSSAHGQHTRLNRLQAEGRDYARRIQALSNMLSPFVRGLSKHFQEHFQEIYDPTLAHNSEDEVRDDRIAGFRLAIKKGLKDPSLWTLIDSDEEYVIELSRFFQNFFADMDRIEGLEDLHSRDINSITSLISRWLSEGDFLQKAYTRVQTTRRGILFDKQFLKPWSYLAGGSLKALLSVYFETETAFSELEKKPKSAEELFAFFIETSFELPLQEQEKVKSVPSLGFLMTAPEHCCLFQPGEPSFYSAWARTQYPFTWVRDAVIAPSKEALEKIRLDNFSAKAFLDRLANLLPPTAGVLLEGLDLKDLSFAEAKSKILRRFNSRDHDAIGGAIDGGFFTWTPFIQGADLEKKALCLLAKVSVHNLETKGKLFKEAAKALGFSRLFPTYETYDKTQLFECVKALYIYVNKTLFSSEDFLAKIEMAAKEERLSFAHAICFADSNWIKEKLAFVVSPTSLELEVWRVDHAAACGRPLYPWNKRLKSGETEWSVFNKVAEFF